MTQCSICGSDLVSYYDQNNSKTVSISGKEHTVCPSCSTKLDSLEKIEEALSRKVAKEETEKIEQDRYQHMVLTTTSAIDGKVITEYKGIVGSQVVAGINVFKDIFAGMRNIVGGRSKQLQESMRKMRSQALLELKEEAFSLNVLATLNY